MTQRGEILIVTGPPGAGKTTTASIPARAATPLSVHLISDDFFDRYICAGYLLPWLPEAAAQNATVMHAEMANRRFAVSFFCRDCISRRDARCIATGRLIRFDDCTDRRS